MIRETKNSIFVILGFVSLALATAGIFLPLLPTVPFVILSAFLFGKGSPRMHSWLLATPQFGSALKQWQTRGAIKRVNKIKALVLILISALLTWFFTEAPLFGKISMTVILLGVVVFILSRPED